MHPVTERIEDLRNAKGVMKGFLARSCGRSVGWYSKLLSTNRMPSVDDVSAIAKALGVKPGYFFGSELDEMESSSKTGA